MAGLIPNMKDYESTYHDFKLKVPEYFNFARDVLDKWAQHPEKVALWWIDDAGQELKKTFNEVCVESCRLANVLRDQGIKKGDVVILILPRLIEWWIVNIACLRIGAIVSPGATQLTAKDIQFRIEASKPACIIADPETASKVDGISSGVGVKSRIVVGDDRKGWANYHGMIESASEEFETENTKSDEDAILYFTSGTTGYPKMALHTHASYPLGHKITGAFWLDLRETDLHWNLSDTGWAKAAWSSLFGPWTMGAAIFVHHSNRFEAATTLEILNQYPITILCAAPTVYRMLVLEDLQKYRLSSLRHCVAAGEPLNLEVIETWRAATGIFIRDGYGQTETVLLAGSFPCLEPRPGSMGKPAPGFELAVIDDQGNVLPPEREGDIAVRVKPERPVGLFKEYWQDPARMAAVHRGDWYITGDRAYRDRDGYLWFVGRADDVILSAGYRIGPFEVESALLEHEAVAESAVVSSPDKVRGEVVKAFVLLRPQYEPTQELVKELQEHVKTVTAPYKYPRKIEFVDNLPKTISGKIKRAELRKKEWDQA